MNHTRYAPVSIYASLTRADMLGELGARRPGWHRGQETGFRVQYLGNKRWNNF